MSTQTDVKTVNASASGLLQIGGGTPLTGTRVKGLWYNATTGGTITLNDGSATGTNRFQVVVPTGVNFIGPFPGEGIRYNADVYLTLTTFVGNVTVFYG